MLAFLPVPKYLLSRAGEEEGGAGGETRAGDLGDLSRSGILRVHHRGRPALVLPGREAPAAFDATCTHLGCVVRWDADASQIRCPCHGARFDETGRPIAGPTRTPLAPIPVRVRDGEIWLG